MDSVPVTLVGLVLFAVGSGQFAWNAIKAFWTGSISAVGVEYHRYDSPMHFWLTLIGSTAMSGVCLMAMVVAGGMFVELIP
jgi:hypothetical protein